MVENVEALHRISAAKPLVIYQNKITERKFLVYEISQAVACHLFIYSFNP